MLIVFSRGMGLILTVPCFFFFFFFLFGDSYIIKVTLIINL